MNIKDFKQLTDAYNKSERMPVLFLGHGSPMNGIESNIFTQQWAELGKETPAPAAVLVVSAHWLTRGTKVTAMEHPRTIHDFGGFPKALFDVQYPAPGSHDIAAETASIVKSTNVGLDHDWGLDHGTWTIVRHMYPNANIPILQLSIDYSRPPQYHYDLARELSVLRDKGVLIIGSGNMVHNLRMVSWDKKPEEAYGYDWALEINQQFKQLIVDGNHKPLIHYNDLGPAARYAIPTPDHYYPLLYTLGLQKSGEQAQIFNDRAVMGSLTMTSVKINA
ncbi:4,5-DOPA dioxygenase extradiol [Dyadobacter sp. CECT 9275]|uniref:4,5-DOPA dioxygenase extradiol n=1 Tax=Dyadobacter helix TaxID=2822344 RepID=A0A916NKV6_9BACT|nr:4,5-DOPA dioxygenase extradiol [Dyadobacter sp. CECT 9275]CAG4997778.1 4,5-DOPA dioxygenase extradiol [Dyadobacter sp. CECT 9275]